jgi:hypothetical protein
MTSFKVSQYLRATTILVAGDGGEFGELVSCSRNSICDVMQH